MKIDAGLPMGLKNCAQRTPGVPVSSIEPESVKFSLRNTSVNSDKDAISCMKIEKWAK